MNSLAATETLSALRDGDALTATAALKLQLHTDVPVTFDLHWLRSLAGSLAGSTGLRFDAEAPASVSAFLSADCSATVRRQDRDAQPWLHLTLEHTLPLSAAPRLTVSSTLPVPVLFDPLRLALIGEHPRQAFRTVLKNLGGAAYSAFVKASGINSQHLAKLAALWPRLTNTTEPVLWNAAHDPVQLSAIGEATLWIASECLSPTALRDRLLNSAGLLVQWVEALTGSPASTVLSDSAFRQATQAARESLPLLKMPELSHILSQVLQAPTTALPASLPASHELARRLYDAVENSLSKTLSAESSRTTLLDASFRMDDAGLALYRSALAGVLTPILAASSPSLELRDGILLDARFRRRTIEIHLPFLLSASREKELASMKETEIVLSPKGHLTLVRSSPRNTVSATHIEQHSRMIIAAALSAGDGEPANNNFSLNFSDVRDIVPGHDHQSYFQVLSAYGIENVKWPAGPARATLNITLPGSIVPAWTQVPLARCETLAPFLCRASLALQSALRRWLPIIYLANNTAYANPGVVLPLLAYQLSQPYARVGRRHYTYDSMDPASLLDAISTAAPHLEEALTRIQSRLAAAGQTTLAARYDPENLPLILQTILQDKRYFAALLAADSFFVEQVLSLARYGRDLSTKTAGSPKRTARDLNHCTTGFVKVFHRRLSRLYAGQDFTPLGPLLLIEATAALAGRRDAIQANLMIEMSPAE